MRLLLALGDVLLTSLALLCAGMTVHPFLRVILIGIAIGALLDLTRLIFIQRRDYWR